MDDLEKNWFGEYGHFQHQSQHKTQKVTFVPKPAQYSAQYNHQSLRTQYAVVGCFLYPISKTTHAMTGFQSDVSIFRVSLIVLSFVTFSSLHWLFNHSWQELLSGFPDHLYGLQDKGRTFFFSVLKLYNSSNSLCSSISAIEFCFCS